VDGLENGNEEDFFDEFEDDFEEKLQESQEEGTGENDDEAAAAEEGSGGDPNSEEGGSADDLERRIEEATKQRFEEFFKRQYGGMVNPLTGRPVQNEADLAAYEQAMAETEYNRRMADAGFDPNVLNNLIGNHPAILSAQRMQQEQQAKEAENFAKSQLGNLLAKYPDCGLTDLNQLEHSEVGRVSFAGLGKDRGI